MEITHAARIIPSEMVSHRPKRRKLSQDGPVDVKEGAGASPDSDRQEDNVRARHNPRALAGPAAQRQSKAHFKSSCESAAKLQADDGMYNSSMFKFQVDELLLELRPDYSKLKGFVDHTLRRVKDTIDSMEDEAPLSFTEATEQMQARHGISIPFPDIKPNLDAAFKLSYCRPSDISVVGSYVPQSMIKGNCTLTIDMVITMPRSMLQEKDYLNYRYFYKRAYYVACLAAGLRKEFESDHGIVFDYLGGNSLQPVVKIGPFKTVYGGDSTTSFQIQVMPAAPQDFFPDVKLRPSMNAVRSSAASQDGKLLAPTPFYNATLRAESTANHYLQLIHQSSKNCRAFRDACMLGQIWLRQRGFSSTLSGGGFGHFEWTILSALLLQGAGSNEHAVLSPSCSSYQLFREVIRYLSTADFVVNPVRFRTPCVLDHVGRPTFYDGPRGHNLLFKMTPWSCAALLVEADISMKTLDDPTLDRFEATFILKTDHPLQKYDCLFRLSLTQNTESYKTCSDFVQSHAASLYECFKEGLTDRVSDIQMIIPESVPWPLMSKVPHPNRRFLVGIMFNPINVDRVVEPGPVAENKEDAARFRDFWGKLAELRRFKDGNIRESLLWTRSAKIPLFNQIVRFLVEHKTGAEFSRNIYFIKNDFLRLLLPGFDTGAVHFSRLNEAFTVLQQDIRNLNGLPLNPKLILATSPQLRFASVQLPCFSPETKLRHPAEVLIQLEWSGRWPDNMVAVQRTKLVFLTKVGKLLETRVDGLTTKLGLENVSTPLLNCAILDVIYPTGAIFRLRIHIDHEQTLLRRQLDDKTLNPHAREEVRLARSLNASMCIYLPAHTQSIAAYGARNSLLSPTMALVKRWFASHLLFGHFREELIELLVMRIFLQPYPWRGPSSPSTGLLRTIDFLSRWDWRTTPLIVDFSRSMSIKDITAIYSRLKAWRAVDPGMNRVVLMAASNHDVTGITLTDQGPSKLAAVRMTALARAACSLIKDDGLNTDLKSLFVSSTKDYDFVVRVSPCFTRQERIGKSTSFKNLEIQASQDLCQAIDDPIQLFLGELKALYSASISLFYDYPKSDIIGGLWNSLISRPFKTDLPYGSRPFPENSMENTRKLVDINRQAILAEIARLGGDMVVGIEVYE